MRFYHLLSGLPFFKKSFSLKILFIAFIGIHIPLFGIIGYLLSSDIENISAWSIVIFTLLFTLFATGVTLIILNRLLKPVLLAKDALIEFKEYSKLPNLPTEYIDEGGVLMR